MNNILRLMFGLVLALLLTAVEAATLTGRVVGIHDGDTITVLDASRQQHKIRLAGIDAPEAKQAYGNRSKQNLSHLVYNRQVTVEWNKRDRYGRTVGVVFVDGNDVSLAQVRAGMAWWYRQYAKEQLAEDRRNYELAENEARTAKRGLWADANPVPPSEWRHRQ